MPRVSIGLPVYNGENFLAEAVESVLAQTWTDWELLIADNASTDSTQVIGENFARQDARINYWRQAKNVGAAPNFNAAFHRTTGEFFQWLAHDDYWHPEWLARCVAALEAHPTSQLAYGQEIGVDGSGTIIGKRPYLQPNSAATPHERLSAILANDRGSPAIFGLMRRPVLAQTKLIGSYDASDQVLLVDMALRGEIIELPEWLYFHREHNQRSVNTCRDRHSAGQWFATSNKGLTTFPEWRLLREYLLVIGRAPLSTPTRWRCTVQFLRWIKYHQRYHRLWEDLIIAARRT